MPIGYRPYEVAQSPETAAEGPHYLTMRILLTSASYNLLDHFQRWKAEIDRITDDDILIIIVGDNEQSGRRYKELRTDQLAKRNAAAAAEYRSELRAQGATRAAEIHINTDFSGQLCIGFVIVSSCRSSRTASRLVLLVSN